MQEKTNDAAGCPKARKHCERNMGYPPFQRPRDDREHNEVCRDDTHEDLHCSPLKSWETNQIENRIELMCCQKRLDDHFEIIWLSSFPDIGENFF